jgi:prevent-host-death family protein
MQIVNVHAAKTNLSKLLERVSSGEEIIIARDSVPVAKLVPVEGPKRVFGALKGKIVIPDSFFDPLPDDELDAWEQ